VVPADGPPGALEADFVAGGAGSGPPGTLRPISSPVVLADGPPGTLEADFVAGGASRWTAGNVEGRFRRRWCRQMDRRER